MAVKRKTEAGAPAFTGAQLLTFDRYRERRDLLGVLLVQVLPPVCHGLHLPLSDR